MGSQYIHSFLLGSQETSAPLSGEGCLKICWAMWDLHGPSAGVPLLMWWGGASLSPQDPLEVCRVLKPSLQQDPTVLPICFASLHIINDFLDSIDLSR